MLKKVLSVDENRLESSSNIVFSQLLNNHYQVATIRANNKTSETDNIDMYFVNC